MRVFQFAGVRATDGGIDIVGQAGIFFADGSQVEKNCDAADQFIRDGGFFHQAAQ